MGCWKQTVQTLAASVLLASAAGASPAAAQNAGTETAAVQTYVERTREISTADYRIDRQPDEGNLYLYRITLNPELAGFAPAERVFDVSVSKGNAEVVGESAVKLSE